ncbi:MAG: hypothetical protein WCT08_04625 [Patescibacteria group bacterium]|jgi:hypothetical protein
MGSLLTGQTAAEIWATLERLASEGVTSENAERIRRDKAYLHRVAACMQNAGLPPPIWHTQLRKVMRQGVFGFDEWHHFFGFPMPDLGKLTDFFPLPLDQLEGRCPMQTPGNNIYEISDTHFAFRGREQYDGRSLTLDCLDGLLDQSFIRGGGGYKAEILFRDHLKKNTFSDDLITSTCRYAWYLVCSLREASPILRIEKVSDVLPLQTGYRLPTVIECVTAIILQALRNDHHYYGFTFPATETRGSEKMLFVTSLKTDNGGVVIDFEPYSEAKIRNLDVLAVHTGGGACPLPPALAD